jgi:selenocysteine lyase/cysteine desulfurase
MDALRELFRGGAGTLEYAAGTLLVEAFTDAVEDAIAGLRAEVDRRLEALAARVEESELQSLRDAVEALVGAAVDEGFRRAFAAAMAACRAMR